MKEFLHFSVLVCGLVMLHLGALGQDPFNDLLQNRPASKNLTPELIRELQENNPVEYLKKKHLYTRSFDVGLINCNNCEVDYFDLFNISLFDVDEFENNRLTYDSFEFDYKGKYQISLHSNKELLVAYNSIESSMASGRKQGLPKLDLEKQSLIDAYEVYKNDLEIYRSNNPSNYDELLNNRYVIKISFSELENYSQERLDSVLNHEGGYLIVKEHPTGSLMKEKGTSW